jgi:hypothetical protein
VRILIDTASDDPIYVAASFKLDRDHWLVRGMTVPVKIDPADPGGFEIVWDEVPSVETLAAANDPVLADPFGTRRTTMQHVVESGVALPSSTAPSDDVRDTVVAAQAAAFASDGSAPPDRLQDSLDAAARAPASAGTTRAVVLISASVATLCSTEDGSEASTRHFRDRHGKHDAVLAVNVPGRDPYAVFKKKWDHKRGKGVAPGAGLPAVVSTSDPTDVEVLWDEMLSAKEQGRQTAADAMQTVSSRIAEATEQIRAEMSQGIPDAALTPPAWGTPGAAVPDSVKAQLGQNAKTALAYTKDPAMRQTLIAQYRAAGIELDDEGNVLP